MSQISKELQEQQAKDVGAAMKKIFGEDVPVIDAKAIEDEERKALHKGIAADLEKRLAILKNR